jgi:hypothetical protein
VAFENMPTMGELTIATSCNSSFIKNKAHLTSIRTPRVNASMKDGTSFGGLTGVTSVRTPRTYATSVSTRHNLVSPRNNKQSILKPGVQGIKIVRPPHQEGPDAHQNAIQDNGDVILKQMIQQRHRKD